MLYTLLSIASLATTVISHGVITSPPARAPGDAMLAACGAAVTQLVVSDNTSHVEDMPEAAAATANFNSTACNVFLCKGLQFADNSANVQTFQPGQVVNMLASIPIPHEGPMNVSVVNTLTNKAIGEPLISFVSYADERLATLPANNTNFDVTIPTTLGAECATAGTCVLQWFWFGTGAAQTYESCVDMVVPAAGAAVEPVAAIASPAVSSASAEVAVSSTSSSAVADAAATEAPAVSSITSSVAKAATDLADLCTLSTTMVTVTVAAKATSA